LKSLGMDSILALIFGFLLFIGLSYSGLTAGLNQNLEESSGMKAYFYMMVGAVILMVLVEVLSISPQSRVFFCIGAMLGGAVMRDQITAIIGFGGFTLTFMIELVRWQQRTVAEAYRRRK
jgi:di/tricarboxylate transporter